MKANQVNIQLENIDKAIELVRIVQSSGQWETLASAKAELYKARENVYRQAILLRNRSNGNVKVCVGCGSNYINYGRCSDCGCNDIEDRDSQEMEDRRNGGLDQDL